MNCFRQVIVPNRKLKKMIILSKFILLIQIIIYIIKFMFRISQEYVMDNIIDIFSIFFLLLMNCSFYYIYGGLYIISTLFNILYLIFDIGVFFQNYFINDTIKMQVYTLIIVTISLSFYIFSMNVVFTVFKEMKAQYLETIGIRYREVNNNRNNEENNNINNNGIIDNDNQHLNNEEEFNNQN